MTPNLMPSNEQIIDTMIELTRLSKLHRVIVAGSNAFDTYLGLHDLGFCRVATMGTCRIPCGQHDVAVVVGQHSTQALEALLFRIVPFLTTKATTAVWVGSNEPQRGKKLRVVLERLGFRVEAGARCENGIVISARRSEWTHIAMAA
jgi:hypothetical protein